jgi:PmbA protein
MIARQIAPWLESELQSVAEGVLKRSKADATEVTLQGETNYLTRFANSGIHQNVAERNLSVHVRVAFGQKVGQGSTNDLSEAGLRRMLEDAQALAHFQGDNPEFPGFQTPQAITPVDALSESTLACTPEDRARTVRQVCQGAIKENLVASGAFTTGLKQLAIANSNGLWASHAHTLADFNTVVMSEDSSGWAAHTSLDAGQIDGEALAEEAIFKALRSRHPQPLEPGSYTVILEEYAVLDLLQYLAPGFSQEEVRQGRSFLTGRQDEVLFNQAISLWDDGHDRTGIPAPFDFEGTPKRPVMLIKEGRLGETVTDLRTGKLEGKPSTGHSSGGSVFSGGGPQAANLFMATGLNAKEEMLESTERGIWVTRFHYVNRLDPRRAVVTGMTRDGTFWIENGKLAHPLQNLRFTHSLLDALQNVLMVGNKTKLEINWWGGGNRAPALKIENFRFSGKTLF